MANIFGTTEEEEDNLLRLYNPQEYYLQNPYLPPVAQPIAPTPDPIILGGNQDNSGNPNANPFGDEDGNISYNPNLVGAYLPGYEQDLNYDINPYANYTVGTTEVGDEDDGGLFGMNNMSFGDIFGMVQNVSPTVMGMKTIGFMRDLVNNALDYTRPEDKPPSAVSYNDVNAAGPNSANSVSAGAMAESYGNIAAAMHEAGIGFGENSGPGRDNTGAGDSIGGCFIKGTMVEMADGTEKEITSINVGEETKGGTVQAKMEYMPHRIYDYKGVKVSGSHWVLEDGQFTEVENSKHGVLTDMIEPVYNFMTSKHRIFIKGVEFGGFYSQNPDYYEPYFKEEKIKINKELSEKTT
tara:strand:+ start:1040 stop:2095 length:1056 start_codon:yes stop_codon:yes gene_type:complete